MSQYKETLNLPKTSFAMRGGLAQKEPKMLAAWEARGLYAEIQQRRINAEPYVLHDGPPYANGHLHHGHILNKVLKDFIVKHRTMQGKRVAYVPGWDCHGLPIEVQVDKKLGKKKAGMSKVQIRKACRDYADRFVGIQRDEFKRLGIFGRWDDPYKTMNFAYEAQTLRELARFVDHGLLYKGLRPVNWCMNHQTALAEAEVEYDDHTSPSVYVAFALTGEHGLNITGPVDLVIWTTTPWTLPANLAICVHPGLEYIAVNVKGRVRIVARGLAESFLRAIGFFDGEQTLQESQILGRWQGSELEGLHYEHPLCQRTGVVLPGTHVTLEAGTGCVHTAPGHGGDDFDVGRRHGLDILSPVDGAGVFTEEAGPFAGRHVFAANQEIVSVLHASGALLNDPSDSVTHRYAHCWRCHQPIILRATQQWWVAMDKPFLGGDSLRKRALASLTDVRWIPKWGEDRIRGMLEARPDWCLSRQRTWGVPIAVVYCAGCGQSHASAKSMNRVADIFEQEGADAWFTRDVADLMGPLTCSECGHTEFRKEEDILDVWFDSGVSFSAVIENEGLGHAEGPPVDLYLEGSDQHRGWFHSSLLCSLGTREQPPYREVLTHGFVVDGNGKKISKSKGNFVDPFQSIKQHGAELWRLWTAAEDYQEDIRVSDEILQRLTDTYRKMRNTMRFLLGNLCDFDPNADGVAYNDLLEIDQWALMQSQTVTKSVQLAYQMARFHGVVQGVGSFCSVDLSSFYLDIIKDRLYCCRADAPQRRSAQTALYVIARDLLRNLAPILCFTTEEAWACLPRLLGDPDSVHLALVPLVDEPEAIEQLQRAVGENTEVLQRRYNALRDVRDVVNQALETARRDKVIGSSTEAWVVLTLPKQEAQWVLDLGHDCMADFFIVSSVDVQHGDTMAVEVRRAQGMKCNRCWLYHDEVGQHGGDVCPRCAEAIK